MLQQKVLSLILSENPSFKASLAWAQKFMERHEIVNQRITSASQKLPAQQETLLHCFTIYVRSI